jgi:hypothetical protein
VLVPKGYATVKFELLALAKNVVVRCKGYIEQSFRLCKQSSCWSIRIERIKHDLRLLYSLEECRSLCIIMISLLNVACNSYYAAEVRKIQQSSYPNLRRTNKKCLTLAEHGRRTRNIDKPNTTGHQRLSVCTWRYLNSANATCRKPLDSLIVEGKLQGE